MSTHRAADDAGNVSQEATANNMTTRRPDLKLTHSGMELAAWFSDTNRGKFKLSRRYQDQEGHWKSSDILLFEGHLLSSAFLLTKAAEHATRIKSNS